MQLAIIGLGRMGGSLALRLLEQGASVVVFNRSRDKIDTLVQKGAIGAHTLSEIPELVSEKPIIVFLYVPSGAATEEMLFGARATAFAESDQVREKVQPGLSDILPEGSIVIDGGNSFFQDSQRRYSLLKEKGLHFLDMGTSGGLEGARNGACLMVGGDEEVYKKVEPILKKIATKDGYGYFGPSGAGHYVKMIHNAVEYGMMGSIAEGMNLIKNYELGIMNQGKKSSSQNSVFSVHDSKDKSEASSQFHIDLSKVARVWAHGSIISGHLLNMMTQALEKDPTLKTVGGEVPRGETEAEMEWLQTTDVEHPVIKASVDERKQTRVTPSFVGQVIAALRREFGGHKVKDGT